MCAFFLLALFGTSIIGTPLINYHVSLSKYKANLVVWGQKQDFGNKEGVPLIRM